MLTDEERMRKFLFQQRRYKKITLRKISCDLGLHYTSVDGWESGYRTPNIKRFIQWANYLGWDVVLRPRR